MHKKKQSKIVAFAAPKDTILARLKTAMKEENTTNNLIKFLHMENAAVLTFQASEKNEIMKKHAEEYAEFYRYFWGSFFNEVVAEAIYKEWGELPQIFRFANACCEYHDEMKLRKYKNQLSREELAEAVESFDMDIPKTIRKEEIQEYETLMRLFSAVVISGGTMVVRTYDKKPKNILDPHKIFAIASDDSGKWFPVPKEVFLDSHTHGPEGEIHPELNAVYTEITRNPR